MKKTIFLILPFLFSCSENEICNSDQVNELIEFYQPRFDHAQGDQYLTNSLTTEFKNKIEEAGCIYNSSMIEL